MRKPRLPKLHQVLFFSGCSMIIGALLFAAAACTVGTAALQR